MRARYKAQHARPSIVLQKGAPIAVGAALGASVLVLGTGQASAQSADDFARLRACESGGNYSINTGNGYYGAYQFSASTWRGIGYSGLPHEASPATQDAAARDLQARSGWGQWPACTRKLGLSGGGGGGSAPSAEARASRSTTRSAAPAAPAAKAAPAKKATTAKKATPARRATPAYVVPKTAPALAAGATFVAGRDGRTFHEEVKAWQARMDQRGWDIEADGYFGPRSTAVAQRFAAEKGLALVDGAALDKAVFDGAWTLAVT